MNATARRRALAEAVNGRGSVPVNELAAELGCSEMTVRRDLDLLERDGVVRRVHGSAVAASLRADEKPYAVRAFEGSEVKERIGLAVAALIADGETVALDAGTTAAEVGRALRGRPVTVMPLGIRTLVDLAYDDHVRLIAPGGDVRAGELVVTGDLAEVAFERLRFDTFVLGVCGIDENGVTTHVPADARVKRAAVASCGRTIAVADRSKLGEVAFGHVCSLSAVDRLVTDAPPECDRAARSARANRRAGVVAGEATARLGWYPRAADAALRIASCSTRSPRRRPAMRSPGSSALQAIRVGLQEEDR